MAYRDPMAAARVRVVEAQEAVDALEERITPALIDQLPSKLGADLEAASAAAAEALKAAEKAAEMSALRDTVKVLERYAAVLEAAIERAPKLGRKFNRLPRAYPERTRPRFDYHFPDVFSKAQTSLRQALHADIDVMDPKARLFDRRVGYFNSHAAPYLVEACFRVDWHPLRLQVCTQQQTHQRTTGYHVELITSYCLLTGVRPSTPELELRVDGLRSGFLAMLGLVRDTDIGDETLDEAFVVDADEEDAARVLRPELKGALHRVMKEAEVRVIAVKDGLARIEWQEDVAIKARWDGEPAHPFTSAALTDAVDVLCAIRATPAIPLLKRLERRRGARRR